MLKRKALTMTVALALCLALASPVLSASQSTTGALVGGGVGALLGQAIGRNTAATLLGAGVGVGVGYIIGNELDKKAAQQRRNVARKNLRPLANTTWKLIRIVPKPEEQYQSWQLRFNPDGTLLNTKVRPDGSVEQTVERYRVVGSTLIINQDDYVINSRFKIEGRQMYMDTGEASLVLERL